MKDQLILGTAGVALVIATIVFMPDAVIDEQPLVNNLHLDVAPVVLPSIEAEVLVDDDSTEQLNEPITASLWQVSDDYSTMPALQIDPVITNPQIINLDTDSVGELSIGDAVVLPLPHHQTYTVVVNNIDEFNNGEISWQGYLDGYGDRYPVIFTLGSSTSFATITTPEGLYTMETLNGSGWVYATPAISQLVDPNKSDHLLPDELI